MVEDARLLGEALATVETLLSSRYGAPVRVARAEPFPHYPQVLRCALEAAGAAAIQQLPGSVVVRVLRSESARSGVARLHNERAALEFLSAIESNLAPRFIASDGERILISEDLGTHPSLLDLLLGSDGEAARRGLLAFARGLGLLHAQTAGHAPAYCRHRAQLGRADPRPEGFTGPGRVETAWQRVREAAAQLHLPSPRGVDADVETVVRTLAEPGPLMALSNGDPSGTNCKIVGGAARFYDFEAATFRHALADAIVLRYPYPTGGPVWRVPPDVATGTEQTYRQELAAVWPEALEDAHYEPAMAAGCAAWTIVRLERLPRVEAGPDRDRWTLLPPGWSAPVPTRSRRRQLVAILETCVASARRAGGLHVLAAWCDSMVHALRERWPEASEETPLFPAFAGSQGGTSATDCSTTD